MVVLVVVVALLVVALLLMLVLMLVLLLMLVLMLVLLLMLVLMLVLVVLVLVLLVLGVKSWCWIVGVDGHPYAAALLPTPPLPAVFFTHHTTSVSYTHLTLPTKA